MPQNGINHPGITALAQALAINPLLRVINLNDNTFTEKGAVAMAKVRRAHGVTAARARVSLALTWPSFLPQTLKTLRQVEVINFGDCLVRSKGAVAIADAVRGGLPKLKVPPGPGPPLGSGWQRVWNVDRGSSASSLCRCASAFSPLGQFLL